MIIELVGLNGRARLNDANHFTTLFQFADADFEAMAANTDQVHQPKDA